MSDFEISEHGHVKNAKGLVCLNVWYEIFVF